MRKYSFDEIKGVMECKRYKFFTNGYYNLNLIGVRSSESKSDKFDDHFHLIYRDSDNRFKHHIFACTTDPGKHWLINPFVPAGTAILVPDQYRGAFKLGIHGRSWSSGGYEALEQAAPMNYVRDFNKDIKLDFSLYREPELRKIHMFRANIKSNIHRASMTTLVSNVGRYSAACQVIQSYSGFKTLIDVVKKSIKFGYGNSFSYTLLEQQDFE